VSEVLQATAVVIGLPAGRFFVEFIYSREGYFSILILLAGLVVWILIELAFSRYL
jgi:hypothetical protein